MEVLRYAEEIKSPNPYFSDFPSVKLDVEMVAQARELVANKAAPFRPDVYRDNYAVAMKELVEQKAKGQPIVAQRLHSQACKATALAEMQDQFPRKVML